MWKPRTTVRLDAVHRQTTTRVLCLRSSSYSNWLKRLEFPWDNDKRRGRSLPSFYRSKNNCVDWLSMMKTQNAASLIRRFKLDAVRPKRSPLWRTIEESLYGLDCFLLERRLEIGDGLLSTRQRIYGIPLYTRQWLRYPIRYVHK